MQDVDRIREANEALDRRARQREAAALAQLELTPEAIAAEEERQRRNAGQAPFHAEALAAEEAGTLEWAGEYDPSVAEDIFPPEGNHTPETLQEKLASELRSVLEESSEDPAIIGLGRLAFQWMLVENDEEPGHQLALQIQVDDQPPAGFVADITPELLATWAKGKGLQGNRTEHKHFAAGLFDRAIGVAATETANQLIFLLEQLMLQNGSEPTRTAVGDADEPFLPEMSE